MNIFQKKSCSIVAIVGIIFLITNTTYATTEQELIDKSVMKIESFLEQHGNIYRQAFADKLDSILRSKYDTESKRSFSSPEEKDTFFNVIREIEKRINYGKYNNLDIFSNMHERINIVQQDYISRRKINVVGLSIKDEILKALNLPALSELLKNENDPIYTVENCKKILSLVQKYNKKEITMGCNAGTDGLVKDSFSLNFYNSDKYIVLNIYENVYPTNFLLTVGYDIITQKLKYRTGMDVIKLTNENLILQPEREKYVQYSINNQNEQTFTNTHFADGYFVFIDEKTQHILFKDLNGEVWDGGKLSYEIKDTLELSQSVRIHTTPQAKYFVARDLLEQHRIDPLYGKYVLFYVYNILYNKLSKQKEVSQEQPIKSFVLSGLLYETDGEHTPNTVVFSGKYMIFNDMYESALPLLPFTVYDLEENKFLYNSPPIYSITK